MARDADVEFLHASGDLLTMYLDVTSPALHKVAIASVEGIYENLWYSAPQSKSVSAEKLR